MSDIARLIKMLQNEDSNKRYEACEQLRVSQSPLPPEALDALAIAKNDKNLDVADAARKALEFHNTSTSAVTSSSNTDTSQKAVQNALARHKTVSSIYIVLTVLLLIVNCGGLFFGLATVGWLGIIYVALIPIFIVAGCIYISKYFIKNNNTKLGYIILYSTPVLIWLYYFVPVLVWMHSNK